MRSAHRIQRFLKRYWLVWSILLLWILAHTTYATCDGLRDYTGKADLAIVLGNTVLPDSSLSPVLQARVDKALQLYRQGRVKKILLSGGDGRPEYFISEGSAMKRYLLSRGVPDQDMIVDNTGQNTYLTAKNFLQMNDTLHARSVIMVTSFYHITRSKYIVRKLGFKEVYGASSDTFYWKDLIGIGRDFFAFYKYVLVY